MLEKNTKNSSITNKHLFLAKDVSHLLLNFYPFAHFLHQKLYFSHLDEFACTGQVTHCSLNRIHTDTMVTLHKNSHYFLLAPDFPCSLKHPIP